MSNVKHKCKRIAKPIARIRSLLKFRRLSRALGFIPGIGSRRSDKRRLCNESPEAKFTLQRDTTNDRVTIVIEETRLYPPRFFFSSELRCSSHPFLPPSPSSNHDKSMIKEEKKKEEPKKTRARVCIEIRKNSEDTVSSLASIWHDSLLFFFCPED